MENSAKQVGQLCKIISALTLALSLVCCAHKPKTAEPTDQAASGAEAPPVISDSALGLDAQGSDSGKINGLTSVHFGFDQSTLSSDAKQTLSMNAKWLADHPKMGLSIEGHCDRSGSTEYNFALGERRAKSVKKYLVNLGIADDRLSTISYGNEKLMDTAETPEADAKNRRANFVPAASIGKKASR